MRDFGQVAEVPGAIVAGMEASAQLDELHSDLLRAPLPVLGPGDGDEAFRQHVRLASTIHRATRLDQMGSENETAAWVRYFAQHFPPGRNDRHDAKVLFKDWRTGLVKDNAPGPEVTVTHGQPPAHWQRDANSRLCIDLESMWQDYEVSVAGLIRYFEANPERAQVALARWRRTVVTVQELTVSNYSLPASGATAMVTPTGSATVLPYGKPSR